MTTDQKPVKITDLESLTLDDWLRYEKLRARPNYRKTRKPYTRRNEQTPKGMG